MHLIGTIFVVVVFLQPWNHQPKSRSIVLLTKPVLRTGVVGLVTTSVGLCAFLYAIWARGRTRFMDTLEKWIRMKYIFNTNILANWSAGHHKMIHTSVYGPYSPCPQWLDLCNGWRQPSNYSKLCAHDNSKPSHIPKPRHSADESSSHFVVQIFCPQSCRIVKNVTKWQMCQMWEIHKLLSRSWLVWQLVCPLMRCFAVAVMWFYGEHRQNRNDFKFVCLE